MRGALLVVKIGGAVSCDRGGLKPGGDFVGLRLAKPVALLERWRVLWARGLIASCGRKRVEVRPSAGELRAAPRCEL